MSAADRARKVVQDLTGMWWPDADEDGLSAAPQLTRNPRFTNNPEAVQKALDIYNGTYSSWRTASSPRSP